MTLQQSSPNGESVLRRWLQALASTESHYPGPAVAVALVYQQGATLHSVWLNQTHTFV